MFREAIESYIPIILDAALRAFVIFIITQGVVYIVGRMLELINSNRGRNLIAVLVSFSLSYWSVLVYDMDILINQWEIYWRTLVYGTSACILFVILGWRMYDRIDSYLDKKVAPDNGEPDDGKRRKRR